MPPAGGGLGAAILPSLLGGRWRAGRVSECLVGGLFVGAVAGGARSKVAGRSGTGRGFIWLVRDYEPDHHEGWLRHSVEISVLAQKVLWYIGVVSGRGVC